MTMSGTLRIVLTGLGLLGLAIPLLFYRWIHGDSDRYLWIINQKFPCSAMGGGPFQLLMLIVLPAAASVMLLATAVLLPGRATRIGDLCCGAVAGVGLVALTAALMFFMPGLFAFLITC